VRTVQQHPNINLLLICATGSAVACSIPRARAATARFSAGHGCRFVLLRWILLICWHLKAAWLEIPAVRRGRQVPAAKQLKLVYLRALSLLDTWIDAVVHWICSDQNVACSLEFYAPRLDPETAQFLLSLQEDRLRLHPEGVEYDCLGDVLPQYDVGLILYRCRTISFVHDAPNKLLEYLSAGMGQSSCAELPSRPWKSTCEDALQPLVQFIIGADSRGNGLNTGCTIAAAINA
jgi:hypothetical protein